MRGEGGGGALALLLLSCLTRRSGATSGGRPGAATSGGRPGAATSGGSPGAATSGVGEVVQSRCFLEMRCVRQAERVSQNALQFLGLKQRKN